MKHKIDMILQGELNPYAAKEDIEARDKHVVRRVRTVSSVAAVNQEIDNNVVHTAGVYEWRDGRFTVFDIHPKSGGTPT